MTTLLELMQLSEQIGPEHYDPKTGEQVFMDHQDKHGKWWTMVPGNNLFGAGIADLITSQLEGEAIDDEQLRDVVDVLESMARHLEELAQAVQEQMTGEDE